MPTTPAPFVVPVALMGRGPPLIVSGSRKIIFAAQAQRVEAVAARCRQARRWYLGMLSRFFPPYKSRVELGYSGRDDAGRSGIDVLRGLRKLWSKLLVSVFCMHPEDQLSKRAHIGLTTNRSTEVKRVAA